jgi:hypothetical protein
MSIAGRELHGGVHYQISNMAMSGTRLCDSSCFEMLPTLPRWVPRTDNALSCWRHSFSGRRERGLHSFYVQRLGRTVSTVIPVSWECSREFQRGLEHQFTTCVQLSIVGGCCCTLLIRPQSALLELNIPDVSFSWRSRPRQCERCCTTSEPLRSAETPTAAWPAGRRCCNNSIARVCDS